MPDSQRVKAQDLAMLPGSFAGKNYQGLENLATQLQPGGTRAAARA
jgi:hypothetical protein